MNQTICPRCSASDINDFDNTLRCRICGCRQRVSTEPELFYQTRINHIVTNALKSDVRKMIALLACAAEPLDRSGLSWLFINSETDHDTAVQAVDSVLHVARCLIKVIRDESNNIVYTLSDELRDAIKSSLDLEISASLIEAENILYRATQRWAELPDGRLREQIFHYGVGYAIEMRGIEGAMAATGWLSNVDYLQARLSAGNSGIKFEQLLADYQAILKLLPDDKVLAQWYRSISVNADKLRQTITDGPVDRLLLQLINKTDDIEN